MTNAVASGTTDVAAAAANAVAVAAANAVAAAATTAVAASITAAAILAVLFSLTVDRTVAEIASLIPGEDAGRVVLETFVQRIGNYEKERNDPSLSGERNSGVRP